jgi:hypothetical protein
VGAGGCACAHTHTGVRVGQSLWPAVTLNGGSECPARARSPMTMTITCCWSGSLSLCLLYPYHTSHTAPPTPPDTTPPIPPIQPYRPFCAPVRAPAAKILTTSPTSTSTRIAQLTHLHRLPPPSWLTTPPILSPHPHLSPPYLPTPDTPNPPLPTWTAAESGARTRQRVPRYASCPSVRLLHS